MIYFLTCLHVTSLQLKLSVFALCQTISIIIHPCHNTSQTSHLSMASHWSVPSLLILWLADQGGQHSPAGPMIDAGWWRGTGEYFHASQALAPCDHASVIRSEVSWFCCVQSQIPILFSDSGPHLTLESWVMLGGSQDNKTFTGCLRWHSSFNCSKFGCTRIQNFPWVFDPTYRYPYQNI